MIEISSNAYYTEVEGEPIEVKVTRSPISHNILIGIGLNSISFQDEIAEAVYQKLGESIEARKREKIEAFHAEEAAAGRI